MALIRWHRGGDDWLSQLDTMQREMDRVFSGYRTPFGSTGLARSSAGVYPPVNIFNDGETFIVRAEVPGVEPATLDMEATGNTLTIRGERKEPTVPNDSSYHRRERDFGSFRRSLTLPEQVESGKVVATYADGILEIRLPFAEAAKRRKIPVKTA